MIIETIQNQSQISSFSPVCRNSFPGLLPKQDIFSISNCDISLGIRVSSAPASLCPLPGTTFTWRPLESQPFLSYLPSYLVWLLDISLECISLVEFPPSRDLAHSLSPVSALLPRLLLRITDVPCSTMCPTTDTTFLTSAGPSRQSCNAFSPS